MSNREHIVDKVRKLLALSESPNENEALSAAEKAQALILEHQITNSELEIAGGHLFVARCKSNPRLWRRPIGMHLSKMYMCLYFVTLIARDGKRYDMHNFFGPRQSVIVTKEMFKYLINSVARLARDAAKSVPEGERAAYRRSFQSSCAIRICLRIRERIKMAERGQVLAPNGQNNLPIPFLSHDEVQRQLQSILETMSGPSMRNVPAKLSTGHAKGVADGFEAGALVGLDTQIGAGKPSAIISGRSQ